MIGYVHTIKADGQITTQEVATGSILDILQNAVGGYIEIVPLFYTYNSHRCVAFCNEEGKLKGLPYNPVATALWHQQAKADEVLFGDVVVCYGDDEFMDAI
jgi:hypothetical protein